jgi:hypothetical protein
MFLNNARRSLGLFCLRPMLVFMCLWAARLGAQDESGAQPSPLTQEAQPGVTLSGRVHAMGSPDPIAGALVTVQGLTGAALSDTKGAYSLAGAAGTWHVSAQADGYAALSKTVQLAPGQHRILDLALKPEAILMEDYVVKGHRIQSAAIQATVSQAEIKEIPGTFGDALRAVQTMPGVALPNDFSGQILVQGAGPSDNLYLIDSIPWPIPFHFGGIVSTVAPDLLNSVDLYEAGYGPQWGGSLAAVLDAKTKAPASDRVHVDADVDILEATGSVEGPVGLGDATFSLSGRRSYFELIGAIGHISPVPSYWDGGGALDFSLNHANHFKLLILASDDQLSDTLSSDSSGDFTIHYNQGYETGGFSWVNSSCDNFQSSFTPYASHTDLSTNFDIGNYQIVDDTYHTSVGIKEEAVWKPGTWMGLGQEVAFGGAAEESDYTFEGLFPRVTSTASSGGGFSSLTDTPALASTVDSQGLNSYAYLQDRLHLGSQWSLALGLHYDSTSYVSRGLYGPRVALEWQPDKDTKATAAWGQYDQAPSPLNVNPQFGNPGLELEQAQHVALSLEHYFNPSLLGRADVYYKTLYDLVVSDPSNPSLYDNQGQGDVKGLDLYLKEDLGDRFFGWITYSLSKSERLALPSDTWSLYQYDQPNIVNVVASYALNSNWILGAKLRYNSGPLIQPPGSSVYSQRLADYMRLDLRADRTIRFQTWSLKYYLEVINVTNRANPAMEFTNSSNGQTTTVDDLPRLPDVGLELKY